MRFKYLLFILLTPAFLFPLADLFSFPPVQFSRSSAIQAQPGDYVPGELIIGLEPGIQAEDLNIAPAADLEKDNQELKTLNVVIIQVQPGQEEAVRADLLNDPGVAYVELNYYVHADFTPNDPLYADPGQYGLGRIQAETAWNVTRGNSSVILAILDSGIDPNHPEFAGRLLPGYDYIDNDNDPFDLFGHGTHVAGIAAAAGNNAAGIAGMDWNASILPLRVLDALGNGNVANLSAALVYAADQGADVVNMSLGGFFESTLLEQATYYAFHKGAALFASAGNSGIGIITKPAAYPWVTAVGATNQSDTRISISDTGPELDVMAPGMSILSTLPGSLYGTKSGTSMSAAFASGTATLLASQALFNSPEKIYFALRHTALDLGTIGFDNATGFGLIQARNALGEDLSHFLVPAPVEYDILSSSECANETFNWIDATSGIYRNTPSQNDNASEVVTLPFTFKYGGVSQTSIRISSNGYLTFGDSGNEGNNHPLASSANPDLIIAPFWDDLNPAISLLPQAGIYTLAEGLPGDRQFIIEYQFVPLQSSQDTLLTFEVILYEATGDIRFQYLTLVGQGTDGSSATVGVEFNSGHNAVQYSYNHPQGLQAGQSIHFIRRDSATSRTIAGCLLAQPFGNSGGSVNAGAFSVVLPSGLIPTFYTSTLSINLSSYFAPSMPVYPDLHHYADIRLLPLPLQPFSAPLELHYHYSAQDVLTGGGHPENLLLAFYDDNSNSWQLLATSVDTTNQILSASVSHLSTFGVFTLPRPEALPVTGAPKTTHIWLALLFMLILGVWAWQKK